MGGQAELYWNGQCVACVEDVAGEDFPWMAGRLTAFSAPPELRAALEWLARTTEAEELTDPPFDEALLEGWRICWADGQEREVSAPIVDFQTGTASWR